MILLFFKNSILLYIKYSSITIFLGISRPITTAARQQSAPYIIRKPNNTPKSPSCDNILSQQRRPIRIVTPQGNVVTQLTRTTTPAINNYTKTTQQLNTTPMAANKPKQNDTNSINTTSGIVSLNKKISLHTGNHSFG